MDGGGILIVEQVQYSGDTPMESAIVVAQTGPMQLTLNGSFTTAGLVDRVVTNPDPAYAQSMIDAGLATWFDDGVRLRVWAVDANGVPIAPSATYTLPADVVLNLTADSTVSKFYLADFGLYQGVPDILCRSQIAGHVLAAEPVGWETLHFIINQFTVPSGTTALDNIEIPVFTTRPGFPPGEGVVWGRTADGSLWQRGM